MTVEHLIKGTLMTLKLAVSHSPVACERDIKGTQYVGKSYKSKFVCPHCSRSTWQHLGFLGKRKVICDGMKFHKQ